MAPPLTKLKKTGELYVRPLSVESNIDGALLNDKAALRRRLRVGDTESQDYLRSECLVHLIRRAHRRNEEKWRDEVLTVLLGRCEAILRSKVSKTLPNAESIIEQVLSNIGTLIALDGASSEANQLDFFECRFNKALQTLRFDAVDRETKAVNAVANPPNEQDQEELDQEAAYSFLSNGLWRLFGQEESFYQKGFRREVREAIQALPPKQLQAVMLVRWLRYDEESEFPEKRTAATIMNCTGRTVRNYLSRAEATIARFKEEL